MRRRDDAEVEDEYGRRHTTESARPISPGAPAIGHVFGSKSKSGFGRIARPHTACCRLDTLCRNICREMSSTGLAISIE